MLEVIINMLCNVMINISCFHCFFYSKDEFGDIVHGKIGCYLGFWLCFFVGRSLTLQHNVHVSDTNILRDESVQTFG